MPGSKLGIREREKFDLAHCLVDKESMVWRGIMLQPLPEVPEDHSTGSMGLGVVSDICRLARQAQLARRRCSSSTGLRAEQWSNLVMVFYKDNMPPT